MHAYRKGIVCACVSLILRPSGKRNRNEAVLVGGNSACTRNTRCMIVRLRW